MILICNKILNCISLVLATLNSYFRMFLGLRKVMARYAEAPSMIDK